MPPSSDQDRRLEHDRSRAAEATLQLVLDVDWVSPSIARDRLRRWLTAHRWSPAHVDDLVLALNEAVSNSIEHGHGLTAPTRDDSAQPVEVHGRVVTESDGARHVELTVRDRGSWRAPADAHSSAGSSRGHGVTIMRACVEEVTVDRTDDGTTVVLRSRSVPPPLT
ncbi:ATP-binding protein [Actinophytocola gossypii]|uniref:ATP-binding protein n=1 Tax=Actinophytocola gossypii TaxID=2812003 RepID=A0ABT2JGM0_9PSEU|nr:ATP-binding protein [Actinophytocola gossypii]MCT2586921.1 ATP-binding protein [Actinophytocola gossypii]